MNSGDEKHAKLALDLFDLNWIKGNESEKLDKNVESDILGSVLIKSQFRQIKVKILNKD